MTQTKRYERAIVLGTMLVPTIGHLEMIKFANCVAQKTHVLIQGRTFEPVPTSSRALAIEKDTAGMDVTVHAWDNDYAPQNPDPTLEIEPGGDWKFWNHWASEISRVVTEISRKDVLVASEPYGAVLAEYLGCNFLPYDLNREIFNVKGTNVRQDLYGNWSNISPAFRTREMKLNIVMFGQESVGKTTLAREMVKYRKMAYGEKSLFVPEYARPYLEFKGPEINSMKMREIACGQLALEHNALRNPDFTTTFFDTDILSTYGYYQIFNRGKHRSEMEYMHADPYTMGAIRNMEHGGLGHKIYVLLPDDIPFEADQLRYGGDKRESTYEFWKEILEEFNCDYIEVPRRGLSMEARLMFINEHINNIMEELETPIRDFERE